MAPAEWNQIVEIFHVACETSGPERVILLDTACGENALLRKAVEELLNEHESAGDFLDEPLLGSLTREPCPTGIVQGQRFGRYVTIALLGCGGMGEVWAARDTELDRSVALKFLRHEMTFGLETEEIIREAKTASALNHPNFVTIYEVLRTESTMAIVMELVEGTSLWQLEGKPLPADEVLAIAFQIANALGVAHAAGIVHGDIKPENILLRQDRYVKVLDFGLSRKVTTETIAMANSPIAGTLRYMSPEQAQGEALTPASDVFSFGLVLYELATGQHAFPASSPFETLQAILATDPPSPASVNPALPAGLDSLLLTMLCKEPSARPSAEAIARTLKELNLAGHEKQIAPPAVSASSPAYKQQRISKRFVLATILAAVSLAVAAILNMGALRHKLARLFRPQIQSVAVLPMEDLAHDSKQEYFVDGMTDQLITDLAQSTSLHVISRTSVMQYKGIRMPLRDVARALNVDAVVESSVERHQGKLRIQAQLLDVRNDRHLWAQTYERNETDVWALQDEITRDIAEQVAATLRPKNERDHSHNRPVNAAALDNYLLGRYYWSKRTAASLKKAVEYFQMAIHAEPQYALAYVGLADTYNVISFYGGPAPSEAFPKAEAAARKALSIDRKLGEAHAALGDNLFSYHWDWTGAESEFRRAIQLSPGYAPAHHWYSELLSALGRHNEAVAEIERARELDPLSVAINQTVGGALYLARRYDEAAAQIQKTIDFDPGSAAAHNMLGWIYAKKGMHQEAIAEFKRAVQLSDDSPRDAAALGWGYGEAGKQHEAAQIAAALETRSRDRYVSPEALARLYTAMGKHDLAIERLEQAYRMRVDTLNGIYVEPCYDPLRSDPRFQDLLRRMNFAN